MPGLVCRTRILATHFYNQGGAGQEGQGTILGLDVPTETIAVLVAEADDEGRSLGTISYGRESFRK
jgi:hypothetical protein